MQIKSTVKMKYNSLATAMSDETKGLNDSKSSNDVKKLTKFLNSSPKKYIKGH